jgi:nicotinamidase/pyrazinamidase
VGGTILWDVDTQVDFIEPGGKLYFEGAEEARPAMARLVAAARTAGVVHLASADDHELSDPEISEEPDFESTWPPHCLRGTRGAEKIPETKQLDPLPLPLVPMPSAVLQRLLEGGREILVPKKHFDPFTNPNLEAVLEMLDPDEIVLFGVATSSTCRARSSRVRPGSALSEKATWSTSRPGSASRRLRRLRSISAATGARTRSIGVLGRTVMPRSCAVSRVAESGKLLASQLAQRRPERLAAVQHRLEQTRPTAPETAPPYGRRARPACTSATAARSARLAAVSLKGFDPYPAFVFRSRRTPRYCPSFGPSGFTRRNCAIAWRWSSP